MGTCLILGGADCVREDHAKATALGEFAGTLAANAIMCVWEGPLTAAVSLHREYLPPFLNRRAERGYPAPERIYGPDETAYLFPGQKTVGSSGLYALKIALLDLGFDRAVLCGVPMDERPHFNDPAPWDECPGYLDGWIEAMPHIRDRTRSCSGWTADALGYPTAAWIKGNQP